MKANIRAIVMLILAPVLAFGVFAGGVKDEALAAVEVVKFSTPVAPDHPNNIAALKFAERHSATVHRCHTSGTKGPWHEG